MAAGVVCGALVRVGRICLAAMLQVAARFEGRVHCSRARALPCKQTQTPALLLPSTQVQHQTQTTGVAPLFHDIRSPAHPYFHSWCRLHPKGTSRPRMNPSMSFCLGWSAASNTCDRKCIRSKIYTALAGGVLTNLSYVLIIERPLGWEGLSVRKTSTRVRIMRYLRHQYKEVRQQRMPMPTAKNLIVCHSLSNDDGG